MSGPLTLYAPTLAVGLTAVLRAAKAAVCGVKRFLSRDDAKSILVLRGKSQQPSHLSTFSRPWLISFLA